eukprot:CAMPEP_0194226484 /NCGR_PEP_ID=MMETSP0156-20130528/41942_1 /TAXON_ID=33649 /ORGANISM="Thalassionema nitzschioides, Strain L26-B" /LENGTH=197 /DNA_ID=CAMNT_0038958845 /DNA_START=110 /DNA_END=700 /DNA_ORIENTATION=-
MAKRNSIQTQLMKIVGTSSPKDPSKESIKRQIKRTSYASTSSTCSTKSVSRELSSTKRVSFQNFVNVRPTLHAKDMTSKEIKKAWYNRKELKTICEAFEKELQNQSTKKIDLRGLEQMTEKGKRRRARNLNNAFRLVTEEQDFGDNNPETIRDAYLKVSVKSQAIARQLGLEDESFVKSPNREKGSVKTADVEKDVW